MARVDVIVVTYNSRAQIRGCLGELAAVRDVNVVVVDNASPDATLEVIADLPITAIPLDRNTGFAHGCNVGWRSGVAEFVLFLNPDARISQDDLSTLVAVLADDPSTGAVAPTIRRRDGSLEYSLRRFPSVASIFGQALFLHRLFPHAPWSDEVVRDETVYEQPGTPDWVSGACLLIRRSALESLGGFDEGFFMYCEDVDLCRRLWSVKLEVRYEPTARCVHEGGASAPRPSLLPVLASSRVRYASKHFGPVRALAMRLGVGLVALTHVFVARSNRARLGHARSLAAVVAPVTVRPT